MLVQIALQKHDPTCPCTGTAFLDVEDHSLEKVLSLHNAVVEGDQTIEVSVFVRKEKAEPGST